MKAIRRDTETIGLTEAPAALAVAPALAAAVIAVVPARASVTVGPVRPGLVDPVDLTVVGDTLFFAANDPAMGVGSELWTTDGTEAGTVLVRDIWPGASFSFPSELA
jgi:ELWxxDGT repeat protein